MIFGKRETVYEDEKGRVQLFEKVIDGVAVPAYKRFTEFVRAKPADELSHIIAFLSRVRTDNLKNATIEIRRPKQEDGVRIHELDFSWTEDIE